MGRSLHPEGCPKRFKIVVSKSYAKLSSLLPWARTFLGPPLADSRRCQSAPPAVDQAVDIAHLSLRRNLLVKKILMPAQRDFRLANSLLATKEKMTYVYLAIT